MRIGVVTYHFGYNFGALIQAYSIRRVLETLGHDAWILDYRPPYMANGGRFQYRLDRASLRQNAGILHLKICAARLSLQGRQQLQSFRRFENTHLRLTRRVRTIPELACLSDDFDALICGSDQIWKPPPRFGVDPAYYLGFGRPGIKRIAYAPSLGSSTVDPAYESEFRALVSSIDCVSVREDAGSRYVEALTGKKVRWLPDPTMLLDSFPCEEDVQDGTFGFCYCLRRGTEVAKITDALSKDHGLPFVAPYNPMQLWSLPAKHLQMSPGTWLGMIRGARFVITNTFHGTVFSVLFRKPFLSVGFGARDRQLSLRAQSLLERLGLGNRFVDSVADGLRIAPEGIDWDSVGNRIEEWRDEALEYLEASLNG